MVDILRDVNALAAMSPAQLRAEWRRVFRRDAPPHSPDLLARAISWRMQAKVQGDLPVSIRSRLRQLAGQLEKDGEISAAAAPTLAPGTRLIREWKGRTIEVTVLESGYLFEDRLYTSLSQIAEHVTGTHWSGPRFFGLKNHRKNAVGDQHGAR